MKKLNKYLVNKDTKVKMQLYQDKLGIGISMKEVWGIQSGQTLIYLEQLNMNDFEIIEIEEAK